MRYFLFFITVFLIVNVVSNCAVAETPANTADKAVIDQSANQTHFRVLPPKIKPVQTGAGISKAAPEFIAVDASKTLDSLSPREGYGDDFWKGVDDAMIIKFLRSKSPRILTPTVRRMLQKAIITPAKDIADKGDLYSLRLTKLVEIGDFTDALNLYKLNEAAPPSPAAARAGVEAMIGEGQMAVACLEQKALAKNLQTDTPDLWKNLDLFCQSLFGPAASSGDDDNLRLNEASRVFGTIAALKAPSKIEEIESITSPVLLAQLRLGHLNTLLKDKANIMALTDKSLAILIGAKSADRDVYFTLLNEGLRRGLVSEVAANQALALSVDVAAANKLADKWANFQKLYNVKGFVANPQIIDELANLGTKSLLSYKLDPYENVTNLEKFNFNNARDVLVLLAQTNHALPMPWIQKCFPSVKSENMGFIEYLLIDSLLLEATDNLPSKSRLLAIQGVFSPKPMTNEEWKSNYDNVFSLTASGNYVMPMEDNLSTLKKSADKKLTGQVVIDSINILSGAKMDEMHPPSLIKIFQALDSVGLNEETVSLAREALGDVVRNIKKEK